MQTWDDVCEALVAYEMPQVAGSLEAVTAKLKQGPSGTTFVWLDVFSVRLMCLLLNFGMTSSIENQLNASLFLLRPFCNILMSPPNELCCGHVEAVGADSSTKVISTVTTQHNVMI